MKDEEFIKKIMKLYDHGDGIFPCSRDCDANEIRDLIEEYYDGVGK